MIILGKNKKSQPTGKASRSICVTPMPQNQTIHDWEQIKKQMHGLLHGNLTSDVQQLKDQILTTLMVVGNHKLHGEAQRSLSNNPEWLNLATWFSYTKWGFFAIVIIITIFLLIIVCKIGINALSAVRDVKHMYTEQCLKNYLLPL